MSIPEINPRKQSRLTITVLVFLSVQAMAFGFPTILTLAFAEDFAEYLIPAIVVLSVPLSVYVSWKLAPRLQARLEPQARTSPQEDKIAIT